MSRLGALALVVALFTASAAQAQTRVERYAGSAYTEDGALAYRETHEEVYERGVLVASHTVYFDAAGAEIGRLDSDYRRSRFAPEYAFEDRRGGESERARAEGRWLVLRRGREAERLFVRGSDPIVLGQGMHQLLKSQLEALSQTSLRVQFGLPGRLAVYAFRIRALRSPRPGVVRLRIEADDWLLRLLAPHLEVDYDLATRRLLRYSGLSNLEGRQGKSEQVVIRYQYGAES